MVKRNFRHAKYRRPTQYNEFFDLRLPLTAMPDPILAHTSLGRDVSYPSQYSPQLLFPIARSTNRQHLDIPQAWHGGDIWNAYELSWLNAKGKPVVAIGRFIFPQHSPMLIESKSFKLYLNSFNETRHDTVEAVAELLKRDLAHAAGAPVDVVLDTDFASNAFVCGPMQGDSIDDTDIEISHYRPQAGLLATVPDAEIVTETLVSDLLKSNCPVTGQPDWGSVQVRYTGPQIDRGALLAYIVSLRQHTEFHEHCVEQMYCDLWHACRPERLLVYARYTRRGGLDINPWRSSEPTDVSLARTPRQ